MPFPTTPVLDTFNRADTADLVGGGGYQNDPFWFGTSTTAAIASNQVKGNAAGSYFDIARNSATYQHAEVFWTVAAVGDTATYSEYYVYARLQGFAPSATPCYWAHWYVSSGSWTLEVQKWDGSSATSLGASVADAITGGDVIGLRVTGGATTVVEAYRNGLVVASRSDSSSPVTAAGYIGVNCYDSGSSARFDDLGGGEIRSPAFPPPSRRHLHMIIR